MLETGLGPCDGRVGGLDPGKTPSLDFEVRAGCLDVKAILAYWVVLSYPYCSVN